MEEIFLSKNSEETKKFAKDFAKKLHGGDVVLLFGNLGAGKTTFVQGLAQGLGIKKRIISPTFIIMRTYALATRQQALGTSNFYHVDLYRLTSENEIAGTGLMDVMGKEENIVVIEWPERLGALKPGKRIEIWFEVIEEEERKLTVKTFEI